ncbi:MAG: tetratricopeptide repeat protein [Burkholderiales bacterium]
MVYATPGLGVRQWLDAGLVAHRQGDLAQATHLYRQALKQAPANADALNLLGTALLQLGQAAEATTFLEHAARAQRNNPRVLANLGQAYLALSRYGDACDAFRKATRLDPQELQFQVGVAASLAMGGKLSEAETLLERLIKRFPHAAAVWLNLGNVMRDQSRRDEAIDKYRKAVELEPELIDARNNLGSILHAKLRFAEAEEQYRECIRLAPDFLLAYFNLASVLIDLGRSAEAEKVSRDLVSRASDAPEALTILGSALGQQGRLLEAHHWYEKAAKVAPNSPKAAETMAMSFIETGRSEQGLRWFSRALRLSLNVESPTAPQMLSGALLRYGALQDGWAEYGSRPYATLFRKNHPEVPITCEPFKAQGKHICVLGEQGLGDELFFLRYAPILAVRGATITYRGSNKLASLLSRLPSIAHVVDEDAVCPAADAYILAGDLPRVLGHNPADRLREIPTIDEISIRDFKRWVAVYWPAVPSSLTFTTLPDKSTQVRDRLLAMGPPPYIGLTWRAGTMPEEQRSGNWVLFKQIEIGALANALSMSCGTLVALQRRPVNGEIDMLSTITGRTIHDLTDLNDDLESMLALLDLLDDYVGVSNTNMHLRAAVGRSARVLVPTPAEWRWMHSGRTSPWFPGFKIYRQSLNGDWTAALTSLKQDLAANFAKPIQSNSA